jgi:CheY-like chemotaxis protein
MGSTNGVNNYKFPEQLKLLVAEDSAINTKLLEVLFQQQNINVDFVENGKQVIEQLNNKGNSYNLILMDLEMPEMNGYDAAIYIRSTMQCQIPIIAMSGYTNKEEKARCIEIGMNEYISKPINMSLLFDKIHALTYAIITQPQEADNNLKIERLHINLDYIKSLSRGNIPFEIRILEVFLEELPPQVSALAEAIGIADYEHAANLIHKMKSSVKMLGIDDMAELLALMEIDLTQGEINPSFAEQHAVVEDTLKLSFEELRIILEDTRSNMP